MDHKHEHAVTVAAFLLYSANMPKHWGDFCSSAWIGHHGVKNQKSLIQSALKNKLLSTYQACSGNNIPGRPLARGVSGCLLDTLFADSGHPNIHIFLFIMWWDEKELDTQFTPNVYFWTVDTQFWSPDSWYGVTISFAFLICLLLCYTNYILCSNFVT